MAETHIRRRAASQPFSRASRTSIKNVGKWFCMADDAEWELILDLEILAAELRRQGMSKKRIREILNLPFRRDAVGQQSDPPA